MSTGELIKTIEEKMAPVIGEEYRHFKVDKLGFRELFELDRKELEKFGQEVFDELYMKHK